MADEQHNAAEQRREETFALLRRHEGGLVLAFDTYGTIVPVPASLGITGTEVPHARTMMDLVVATDHAAIVHAWRATYQTGRGQAHVRLLNAPDQPVQLTVADLRTTDGVIVAVVAGETSEGVTVPVHEVLPAVPRFGVLHQTHLGEVTDVDAGFTGMLGWTVDELRGSESIARVHPDDQAVAIAAWMEMVDRGLSTPRRWRTLHRDGTYRWIEVVVQRISEDLTTSDVRAEIADVTEEVVARERLEAQELRLNRLAQVVPVGLFQVDHEGAVVYANDRLHDILGTTATSSLSDQLTTVVGSDRARVVAAVEQVLGDAADVDIEVEVRPGVGEPRRCLLAVRALVDRLDAVTGVIVCVSDVTETARRLVRLERDLIHRSFHDSVTGLPNRTLLINGMEDAIVASRETGAVVAVLLVDMDGFKAVNDSLGHSVGDELLRAVSDRIRAVVRPADLVARVGGDEFAVLMEDYIDPGYPRRTAAQVLAACSQPFEVDGHLLQTNVSIGIATSATAPGTEELLRDADLAMYRAKAAGRGRFETFEPEMHAAVMARVQLEASLREGVNEGQLLLVYQPILDLQSRAVTSVEALVRWRHPVHGLVSPADFIPLAEETGLIVPIGRFVLEAACAEAAGWVERLGAEAPRVSVNLSARQLASPTIVDDVDRALARARLDPSRLVLEITESVLMESSDANARLLQTLRDRGVALAIDDFGTGYSSLAYLERLPVQVLKIDKAFVDRIGHGGRHTKLIKGIISLSHDLGLTTVAEGIETAGQLEALERLHCRSGQGYHFSRPVEADALLAYLQPPADRALAGSDHRSTV